MPRKSSRRREGRSANAVNQLPWRSVENSIPPVALLSEDQLEAIHQTSLRILEELGIEFMSDEALSVFKEAGCDVDKASGSVRFDRAFIEEMVAKAPSQFTLTPRNPEHRLTIGGKHLCFASVSGPPNVSDLDGGRRAGNFADFKNLLKLAQSLNVVQYIGNQICATTDLSPETRHLDCSVAAATFTDRVFSSLSIGAERAVDTFQIMAMSRGETLEDLEKNPGILSVINVNSPRRFDGAMAEGLMALARHGQATVVTPFTLMGAMTAVSLPAALAQQNAEALAGIVLTQIVNPGAPVIYGAFTSNVDMKSGAPAFGTPEYAKATIASGQLIRRYGLPYRSSNPNASNCVDAQAAYESMMSIWSSVLGGANIVNHGAGWLEGGLTASFEKMILDAEMIQGMIEFLMPIKVDEAELGFEAIAGVGPGGHFFGEAHTLERYETAFYAPMLSDWRNFESWEEAGAEDATLRANKIWKQLLAEYEPPPLPEDRREAMEAYIARRREEIERRAA